MTAREIRIAGVADFSSITKEVTTLSKTINSQFGKRGVQIFNEKDVKFLSDKAKTDLSRMNQLMKALTEQTARFDDELSNAATTNERFGKVTAERTENLKRQVQLQKQIRDITQAAGNLPNVGASRGRSNVIRHPALGGEIVKGAGSIASALPGPLGAGANIAKSAGSAYQAGAGVEGGSAALGVTFGALAAAVGGLVIGIGRASAAFEVFKAALPTRLDLQAMGTDLVSGVGRKTAIDTGFDAGRTAEIQKALNQALGALPKDQEENRLGNTMLAGRDLGVSPEMIAGMGNQLRSVGGTEAASKQLANVLDKAITSGLDKSQATTFLQSATGLLTQLNETGTRDTDRLLGVMTDLVGKNGMSPEQASRRISGISQAIAGSTGANNAFFQSSAAMGGVGGDTLLGSQLAVRQGLTGINGASMSKQLGGGSFGTNAMNALNKTGLTDPNFSQKFAKGILSGIDAQGFDSKTTEGQLGRSGFVMDRFGSSNIEEAMQTEGILRKVAAGGQDGLNKGEKKIFGDLGKSPDERWRGDVLSKLDLLATLQTEAQKSFVQMDLGQQVAPYFNALTAAMTKLDESIGKLIGGVETMPSALGQFLEDLKNNPRETVSSGAKAVGGSAIDMVTYAAKALMDLPGQVLVGFMDMFQKATNWIFDTIKNLFREGAISSGLSAVQKVGNSVMDSASDAVINGVNTVDQTFDKIGGWVKGGLGMTDNSEMSDDEISSFSGPSKSTVGSTGNSVPANGPNDSHQVVELLKENNALHRETLKATKAGIRPGSTQKASSRMGG